MAIVTTRNTGRHAFACNETDTNTTSFSLFIFFSFLGRVGGRWGREGLVSANHICIVTQFTSLHPC